MNRFYYSEHWANCICRKSWFSSKLSRQNAACIFRYYCACADGFTGSLCEMDVDECDSDPCQSGATCFNRPGAYLCECRPGWTGRDDIQKGVPYYNQFGCNKCTIIMRTFFPVRKFRSLTLKEYWVPPTTSNFLLLVGGSRVRNEEMTTSSP